MREILFKKGDMVATLVRTEVEVGDGLGRYRWATRLGLIGPGGCWMVSKHWNTRAWRQATIDLEELGWTKVEP